MKWIKLQLKRLKNWITRDRRQMELPLKPSVTKPVQQQVTPVEQDGTQEDREIKMHISAIGLSLIMKYEGFYSKPYICPAGIPTIGFGTIQYPNGKYVTLDDKPVTREEAKEYLYYEVDKKCDKVLEFMLKNNFLPTQNELDAVTSFAYNLGTGRVTMGSVAAAIRSGNKGDITKAMLQFNKAKVKNFLGIRVLKELKGLTKRRQEEVELFNGTR